MNGTARISRALCRRHETDWLFVLPLAVVFAVVQAIGHWHHEMWRDELHFWALARKSEGLWDLFFGERRYDGHPVLWYYLLYLASGVTRSSAALQVVGASLSVAAAVVWLRFAPVPRWLRVMLLGSYYIVYEYGVMNRNYTLGVLLTFVFCALYQPYRPRYLVLAVVLALLSASSMYGTIIGVALAGFLFSSGPHWHDTREGQGGIRLTQVRVPAVWVAAVAVFAAGLLITVLTTLPPADAQYVPPPLRPVTRPVVEELLTQYWRGMFPFGSLADWNWPGNDALLSHSPAGAAAMPYLGAIWFACCVALLWRSPRAAATYVAGVLMMATAQHTVYGAGWRHLGHYFILLVACLWLHAKQTRGRAPDALLHCFFAANIAVQILTGFAALRTDYVQLFSGSQEAARFIRQRGLQDLPMVADFDDPVTPVAVILDRPFFFPAAGQTTDTTLFRAGRHGSSPAEIVEHAQRLARTAQGAALLVLNYEIPPMLDAGVITTLIYKGGPAILGDESYRIYDVKLR